MRFVEDLNQSLATHLAKVGRSIGYASNNHPLLRKKICETEQLVKRRWLDHSYRYRGTVMIINIGVDTAETSRIERLLNKNPERLFEMVLNGAEQVALKQVDSSKLPSYIAGRWAAKEAVLKTLGTGIGPISLPEIGIFNAESGKPFVLLIDRALAHAEQLGINSWHISITHTSTAATAFVTAEKHIEQQTGVLA